MTDRDAHAFRASLNARLMNRSQELGYDVNRQRRHVVFHRILARLATRECWVPKGGFALEARLAGREFASVVVDAVGRSEEIRDAIGPITIPPPVAAPGLRPVTIAAVDIAQHAAEKFHAMARRYAGDRPSTRVKDLLDLVLMLETGLLPDPKLGGRLRLVYEVRDGGTVPEVLADPPAAWRAELGAMASEVDLETTDLDEAMRMVRDLYRDATA